MASYKRLVLVAGIAVAAVATAVVPYGGVTAAPSPTVAKLKWDGESTIRNPGMGWMIYAEEFGSPLADAEEFWATVDPHVEEASVLYLRVPWSRLEPSEGRYAWDEDENYQRLVDGARERGLRLAFRVFVDSQHSHRQATPQFVFDAGAVSYPALSNPELHNPTIDDVIFREKFETFLAAFGAEYDDPARVDFVDMNTVGWWGEMHSIPGLTEQTWTDTVQWLGTAYRNSFHSVLLALNINPDNFGYQAVDEQFEAGAIMRRDSFGSTMWFSQQDKDDIAARWSGSLLIAENCYQSFTTRETACDESFKPIRAMLERVVADALDLRANYLDLRHPEDVVTWARDNPDLVEDFAVNGGYRIGPIEATLPAEVGTDGAELSVAWQNTGVGRMPNDNPQWDHKYKVAYALFDPDSAEPVRTVTSVADPGGWYSGQRYLDTVELTSQGIPDGRYQLAAAIVDSTRGGAPAVELGVNAQQRDGWVILGEVSIGSTQQGSRYWPLVALVALAAVGCLGAWVIVSRCRPKVSSG